jgi:hypothetical protein
MQKLGNNTFYLLILLLYAHTISIFAHQCLPAGPLIPGRWAFQVKGGIAPLLWFEKTSLGFHELPHFNELFKLPFTLGGILGWSLNDHSQVFLDCSYVYARVRKGAVALPNCFGAFYKKETLSL